MVQVRQPFLRTHQETGVSKVVALCIAVNLCVLLFLLSGSSSCDCNCQSSSNGTDPDGGRNGRPKSQNPATPALAPAPEPDTARAVQRHAHKQERQQHAESNRTPSSAAKDSSPCAPLSRALLQRYARDSTIVLAVSDWRMFSTFGDMWLEGLQHAKISNYVIAATDAQTIDYINAQGIGHCMSELAPQQEAALIQERYAWGSAAYNAATWHKPAMTLKLLQLGFNVLHTDLDVRWLADPMPWLARHAQHADMLMSSDLVTSQNQPGDDGPDPVVATWVPANTGVWFARASPGGIAGVQGWLDQKAKDPNRHDNLGFLAWFTAFKGNPELHSKQDPRMLQLGKTALGMLPVSVAMNGYTYSLGKLHQLKGVQPLCVHMTWVSQHVEGKVARLRENQWYPDRPEYYTAPKLLTMDLYIPPTPPHFNNWTDSEAMIGVHLQALKHQLAQLYPAMALSVLLGRTLVLPQLRCFCWNNWYASERCRIPGDTLTQLPWDCSLEQIFQPKALSEVRAVIGNATFSFREASFLSNPRLPASVAHTRTVVDAGSAVDPGSCSRGHAQPDCVVESPIDSSSSSSGSSDPASGSKPAGASISSGDQRRLLVSRGLKDVDIVDLLQPYAGARTLHVSNPVSLWGGFADAAHKQQFEAWLDSVTASWCCRMPEAAKRLGLPEKEKLRIRPKSELLGTAARQRPQGQV